MQAGGERARWTEMRTDEEGRHVYLQTPRTLDEDLKRKARGDRGCLGDALSATGALAAFILGVTASLGLTPMGWALAPVGVLITGFVIGAVSQGRSGRSRTRALEGGPLVRGAVLRADPWLYEEGRRAGRAAVLFVAEGDRRLDDEAVNAIARQVLAMATARSSEGWAQLASGGQSFGFEPVPTGVSGCEDAYVADVVVYPEQLEGRRLPSGSAATLTLIVSAAETFVEHV